MTTSTYEMIRALPGKGTNWRRLVDALRDHYLAVYATKNAGATPWAKNTTDEMNAAKGIRELRHMAMYAATLAVDTVAVRSSFIPPSEETLSWGGFLGGETVVYKDAELEKEAVARIAEIIKQVS